MTEWRGVIEHIAEGSYEGTISWQKNDASNVSSHFIVAKDGRVAQMVDTDQVAWTQAAGNGRWLSIENEGFSGQELTAAQVEASAQIYAKGVRVYGYPVQLTESPEGRGLGWHGMGGVAWGNHPNCPGLPIRNQRDDVLVRVNQILGLAPGGTEDEMFRLKGSNGTFLVTNSVSIVGKPIVLGPLSAAANADFEAAGFELRTVNYVNPEFYTGHPLGGSLPSLSTADLAEIRKVMASELAKLPPGGAPSVAAIVDGVEAALAAGTSKYHPGA